MQIAHVNAVKSLFDRIGNGILVTHSAAETLAGTIQSFYEYKSHLRTGGNFIFLDGETVAPWLYKQQIAFETVPLV